MPRWRSRTDWAICCARRLCRFDSARWGTTLAVLRCAKTLLKAPAPPVSVWWSPSWMAPRKRPATRRTSSGMTPATQTSASSPARCSGASPRRGSASARPWRSVSPDKHTASSLSLSTDVPPRRPAAARRTTSTTWETSRSWLATSCRCSGLFAQTSPSSASARAVTLGSARKRRTAAPAARTAPCFTTNVLASWLADASWCNNRQPLR
mmetsp:Transcript_17575/g.48221  ORF Transcript_17575/g.48221 Transcript_17575/m.48221 type:complete len:209 (-) Transcript_17575:2355-2981(-)